MKNIQKSSLIVFIIILIGVVLLLLFVSPKDYSGPEDKLNNLDSRTYADRDISFKYSLPLNVIREENAIVINHSIPHTHPNPCDFVGNSLPLKDLTDFNVSIEVINSDLKSYVLKNESVSAWDYISQNPFPFGPFEGYKISSSVESCGQDIYYFTVSPEKSLIVRRKIVTEFRPIISNYETYLSLPGVIKPNEAELLFIEILSSIAIR